MSMSSKMGMGGRLGGMFRMGRREKRDDKTIETLATKTIRDLVAFATSMEYTIFQLEDQRTVSDLRAYLDAQEIAYPYMREIIPVSLLVSLMNPKHSANVDTGEVVKVITQYVSQATYAVHVMNKPEHCMEAFMQVRDTIIRLVRTDARFCEIVTAINAYSGFLQRHSPEAQRHAQFIHKTLLVATNEYRKRNR